LSGKLETYIVGIRGEERGMWNECEVVCAESSEHAVRLAHPDSIARDAGWVARVLGDGTDYEVERYPEADALATEAKVIHDDSLLRPFGWHYDGERQCQGCESYSEDTCPECDLCHECQDGECEACREE
jgi:hypothetical protein